jgi:hypothetical protein
MHRLISTRYLIIFFAVCSFSAFAQTPDPGLMGTHTVIKAEYDLGDLAYAPPAAAMFPSNMEVRGSVHYPSDLASGPFPVLLWLHGRHSTCYETADPTNTSSDWPCLTGWQSILSYEGYDYAAKTMASHGYIVISISSNAINAIDGSLPPSGQDGMNARGVLVQHHLDLWKIWNTTGAAPFGTTFVGRLNMQNIGTMGHSRGGEGVIFNAEYNKSLGSPYGIKAILTLAPVDFYRHIANRVPLMNIAPYCDGDVSDLQGVHFYDDVRYNDTGDVMPKHNILVMGANHNYFNTVWTPGSYIAGGEDDWLYTGSPADVYCGANAVPTGRLDTTRQKAVYNAYAAAFYRLYLGGETQFAPLLEVNDITPPVSSLVDTSKIFVSYHAGNKDRLDVNTTDVVADLTLNTLAGAVTSTSLLSPSICGGGLTQLVCDASPAGRQKPHRGTTTIKGLGQMKLAWSDTTAFYQNVIPQLWENMSNYKSLSFRASANFSEMPASTNRNFTVRLIDSAGNSSDQVVSNFTQALFYQPGTTSGDLPKVVFNTIHLPISGFTGISLSKVRKIKFVFNKSTSGAILISDLALTNPVCGSLNALYTDSIGKRYKIFFTNKTVYTTGDSLTWLWHFGNPTSGVLDTSTLKTPTHTYTGPGTYTACLYVTDYRKNGLVCRDTFCTAILLANDAVPELYGNEITIFPNPAKGFLVINGVEKTDVLTLVNLYGQVVLNSILTSNTVQLPAIIPTGVYTAVITTANGRVVRKVVIER